MFLVLQLGHAAAVDGRRVRRDEHRPADLDGQRRRAGQIFGAAEVRRARRRRPAQARRARHRHRRGRQRDLERERRTCRPARCTAPSKTFTVQANGQLLHAAAYGPIDRRLPQRQPGAARRGRARLRRRRERQERPAGTTASATIYLAIQQAAGHERRRRSSTTSRRCCRRFREQLPAVGDARRPQRPLGVDPRVGARRQAHAAADHRRWSSLVIFLFLRNVSATIIPSLALPGVDRRHVRGDVPARLQPRQPVADGAHALGRLRRRRRDRDAGEHRPAHGDGQGADAGGASTARRRSPSPSSR